MPQLPPARPVVARGENHEPATVHVPVDVHENTLFEWIPVHKMFIDSYGRTATAKKVDALVKNFEWNAIGMIYVSMRENDRYAIIDGHHRFCAATIVGYTELPCRVYIDLTYQQEAELYNRFATVNLQSALDKFRARIEADDTSAWRIQHLLRTEGLEIAFTGPGHARIMAVSTLEKIVAKYGYKILSDTLRVLKQVWEGDTSSFTHHHMYGMATFMIQYSSIMDEQKLISSLKRVGREGMLARFAQMKALIGKRESETAYGQTVRVVYNENVRKAKLPDWKQHFMPASFYEGRSEANARGWATRKARQETN